MSRIWDIHEYLRLSNRCFFDSVSQKYTIKNDDSIDPHNVGDGCFQITGNILYALVRSEKGPVFICNDRVFILNDIEYFFDVSLVSPKKCRFIFKADNVTVVNIVYDKPSGWDAWDMDLDFFHWLAEWSHKDEFIEHFTELKNILA